MLDDNFKVYLIEVNTNPCLAQCSPLLTRLIPELLENTLQIALDPLFPPPDNFTQINTGEKEDLCPVNKYELIFDEQIDGAELKEAELKTYSSTPLERADHRYSKSHTKFLST